MSFETPHEPAVVARRELREASRARAAFVQTHGDGAANHRQWQIDQLPKIIRKGRQLYTLRCRADFGKGPHDVNVPEHVLWALIDFRAFRCPFHRG